MTTGTIVMIVCAVLYGLIVILFKEDMNDVPTQDIEDIDDMFMGLDGTPGACDLCSDDLDIIHPK